MQTEVPTLPVVQLTVNANFDRNQNSNLKKSTTDVKPTLINKSIAYSLPCKKSLHPSIGQPYQSSVRQKTSTDRTKVNKNSIKQIVLSARMLRVKELQNQLADAHYQLNELANENRLLKSLQKRQDSALKRYEGTNAELPRIINSHQEDVRILQIKYKKLKALHKETCHLLKEKENELQQLQTQNKHLLQLSKDRNLGEREKLQSQIYDLNYRIQQQQDTIQTLHRKLSLESKSFKQQLYTEISKRKATQKHLEETTEKLKSLEHLLDSRERKLYCNGQLSFPTKSRQLGTQLPTSSRDIGTSNSLKLSDQHKNWQNNVEEHSLPALNPSDGNDKNTKADETIDLNRSLNSMKTETMANLEQIRKYRLQKSAQRRSLSDDFEETLVELNQPSNKDSKNSMYFNDSEKLEENDEDDEGQFEISAQNFRKIYENRKCRAFDEPSKTDYSSANDESDGENDNFKNNQDDVTISPKESRIRLRSSRDEVAGLKELLLSNSKYGNKLDVLAMEKDDSYKVDFEADTGGRKGSIGYYLSSNRSNGALKLVVAPDDNRVRYNSDQESEKLTISHFLNESQKMYQNLISEMGSQAGNVENENLSDSQNNIHIDSELVDDTSYSIDKFSEDLQELIVEEPTFKEEATEGNIAHVYEREDELQDTVLMQMALDRDNDKIKTLFTSDSISHVSEISSNEPQDRLLAPNSCIALINTDKQQTSRVTYEEDTDDCNVETRNKINKQEVNEEIKDTDISLSNTRSSKSDSFLDVIHKINVNNINENDAKVKTISYNKEKLLATMKAIDDNENIEYLNQDYEKDKVTSRKQITENLFRGVPTHMKKKQDIIKDIFNTDGLKNEPAGS
ncbi:uncharacterized protein LOC143209652 isoform X1 [Lasioglossum baleicum]|uniref:uncharacterized protein LOC143209652 isoform X1 n=2 Tax=Lasioglossum baleicum TaxID=434251 RepID=UPI003FCD906C